MFFFGYIIIALFPSFASNLVIMLKELTMRQTASKRSEDFKDGYLFDDINLDWIGMIGIPEDEEYYTQWFKDFLHFYL